MSGGEWALPQALTVGGRACRIYADYRDVLGAVAVLNDAARPEWLRWQVALALFYADAPPADAGNEAMRAMAEFIAPGPQPEGRAPVRLIDWEQDAGLIAAEINKAAGREVRALPFLHWWTFLGYFHTVGEGRLATLVRLRDKLRRGKRLEPWEREFYRENRAQVDLKPRRTAADDAERARLLRLLDGPPQPESPMV